MAIDDVYILTMGSSISAQVNMNNLAFRRTITGSIEAADFEPMANQFKDIHRAAQSSFLTYTSWKARQVRGSAVTWPPTGKCNPVGGLWFEGLYTAPLSGSATGDVLPQQCAMVTTLRTGTIGRRYRGRVYVGGWAESAQNAGLFDSAVLTPVNAAWDAYFTEWVTDAPTNGWELGVWSTRIASGCERDPATGEHEHVDPPNPGAAFTPLIDVISRQAVYTQRRRVIGVGV